MSGKEKAGIAGHSWAIRSLVLALAYYLAGRAALLLAIPPGYATAVWPAAGIALAGLLAFGRGAWPGIALASLLANFPTAHATTATLPQALGLSLALGLGASVQAVLAATLVRIPLRDPALLVSELRIGRLLAMAGPLSCTASASMAAIALWAADVVPSTALPTCWATWWVGDTIGVLVVMPLSLAWRAPPRQLSRSGRLSIGVSAAVTLCAVAAVFHQAQTWGVLAAGMLFVALASTFLLVLAGRRLAVEQLVQARTAELRASNQALLEHEQRITDVRDNTFDAYVVFGHDGTIAEWNVQAERLFGWTRAEAVGRNLAETIVPLDRRAMHLECLRRCTGGEAANDVETCAVHREGHQFPVEVKIWERAGADGAPQFHAFLRDIGARRRAHRRLAAQTTAAAALIESDTLADAAPRVLQAVCVALDWSIGMLWLVDGDGDGVLRLADTWHARQPGACRFTAQSGQSAFAPGVGLPGRVLQAGRAAWIADVGSDPNFPRSRGALEDGLHGAFAVPVLNGAQCLGVLEFFSSSIQQPDQNLLDMMDTLGSLLGQFIARVDAERALEREGEFIGAVLDNITEGIVACDGNGTLAMFNRATRELHGVTLESLPPEQWADHYDLYLPDGVTPMDTAQVPLFRAFNGEQVRDAELVIAPKGQPRRTVVCNGRALIDRDGRKLGAVVAMHDITERKEAEQRLQQLAHFDPLTGLPNRRLFQESLRAAMAAADAQAGAVYLLYLDLDKFKDINDTLGHAIGDELLRQVGQRLLGCVRVRDTVGRLGGDEFGIVLLSRDDPQVAVKVANKIRAALAEPFELEGNVVGITTSIGITAYPADTADVHSLARYADLAMYEAKQDGRNAHRFYTEAMNQRARDRLVLESALRGALARGEFVLHYQPKVCLRTGRWTGVEALLRWQRPDVGLVPPAAFIPMLEDTGLIVPVGAWVVEQAFRQLRLWREAGMHSLPIAVNLSAQQVSVGARRPGDERAEPAGDATALWSAIDGCLRDDRTLAELLEVELTESIVMDDAEFGGAMLQRLKALGIRMSLDDFGTGYSSLAYLRRLPLDTLKIDRSFIDEVTSNPEDASITLAIIGLAHQLNLKVVAEGVETAEQLEFLRAHGCDQAQGFHIARPMSAEALERLWRDTGGRMPQSPAMRAAALARV